MFIAIPKKRLKDKEVGEVVQLHGDGSQRKYVVVCIRSDGYYELAIEGRKFIAVTASKDHLIL